MILHTVEYISCMMPYECDLHFPQEWWENKTLCSTHLRHRSAVSAPSPHIWGDHFSAEGPGLRMPQPAVFDRTLGNFPVWRCRTTGCSSSGLSQAAEEARGRWVLEQVSRGEGRVGYRLGFPPIPVLKWCRCQNGARTGTWKCKVTEVVPNTVVVDYCCRLLG